MGSGSVVNDLAFVYSDFGQLVTEYQQHGCAVNTGTSLNVQYAYADGSPQIPEMYHLEQLELTERADSIGLNRSLLMILSLLPYAVSTFPWFATTICMAGALHTLWVWNVLSNHSRYRRFRVVYTAIAFACIVGIAAAAFWRYPNP